MVEEVVTVQDIIALHEKRFGRYSPTLVKTRLPLYPPD